MINASEKEAVLKQYPDVHIVRTMKTRSKRHHYYMVEEPGPVALVMKMRGLKPPTKKRYNNRNRRKEAHHGT